MQNVLMQWGAGHCHVQPPINSHSVENDALFCELFVKVWQELLPKTVQRRSSQREQIHDELVIGY